MAWAPAFIDNGATGANSSTHTFSGITFPTGKVAVGVWENCSAGQSVASVTVNGVSATRKATCSTIANCDVAFWEADVSSGTGSVVVQSTSGNFTRGGMGVWDVTDGEYIGASILTDPTDNPVDLSINTVAGDAFMMIACSQNVATAWAPTGYTENFDSVTEVRAFCGGINANCTGASPETFSALNSPSHDENSALGVLYREVSTGTTITGSDHTSADTFGAGTVTTGAVTITGADHTSADTFGAGTITQGYTVSGAAHTPAASFGAGSLATGYTITGASHTASDTFGGGAITQGLTIAGAAHTNPDTFGSGAISTTVTITGTDHTEADTFGSGDVTQGTTLTGTAHTSGDTFGAGSLATVYTITGVAFTGAPAFGVGTITGGEISAIIFSRAASSRSGGTVTQSRSGGTARRG